MFTWRFWDWFSTNAVDEYGLVIVSFYSTKWNTEQSNKDPTDNHNFAAVKWNSGRLTFRMYTSTEWIDSAARFSCLPEAVLNGLMKSLPCFLLFLASHWVEKETELNHSGDPQSFPLLTKYESS